MRRARIVTPNGYIDGMAMNRVKKRNSPPEDVALVTGKLEIVTVTKPLEPADVKIGVIYSMPGDLPRYLDKEFVTGLEEAGASKDVVEAARASLA